MLNINDVSKSIREAATLLKALSNERRLHIVSALYEGEKSVGELERLIGLSQSALSQHLARLRRDQVVKTRREAQTIFYSLDSEPAYSVLKCLHGIYCDQADAGT